MLVARKTFVSAAFLAASASALAGCSKTFPIAAEKKRRVNFHILQQNEYDYAGMMAKLRLPNPHKQLFQSVQPIVLPGSDIASIFIHMQNAANGYDFSLGPRHGTLATLGVFIGSSVVFSLNDAMWEKYRIGEHLNLAKTNIYYPATSKLDAHAMPDDPQGLYQDWSAQAVLKRGGSFMVCHNALTSVAASFAAQKERNPTAVLTEFLQNMLPGFMIVPAGVTAVQLAQENGWKIYPII